MPWRFFGDAEIFFRSGRSAFIRRTPRWCHLIFSGNRFSQDPFPGEKPSAGCILGGPFRERQGNPERGNIHFAARGSAVHLGNPFSIGKCRPIVRLDPFVYGRVARATATAASVGERYHLLADGAIHGNTLLFQLFRRIFKDFVKSGLSEKVEKSFP